VTIQHPQKLILFFQTLQTPTNGFGTPLRDLVTDPTNARQTTSRRSHLGLQTSHPLGNLQQSLARFILIRFQELLLRQKPVHCRSQHTTAGKIAKKDSHEDATFVPSQLRPRRTHSLQRAELSAMTHDFLFRKQ
jgi:hypothetical protein